MQLIKQVFNFYVFGNIHVALATFCLTKITLLAYEITDNEVPFFVFFATVLSYNFIRLYRKSEITSIWFLKWITTNKKKLFTVSTISLLAMLFFTFKLSYRTILSLVPFGLLTLFYIIPYRKILKTKISLRTLSGFKLFLIAFCWAGVTVLIPLVAYEINFSKEELIIFLQRFLLILAITIPFDIRDLNFDSENLKTLPQMIGVKNSIRIGIVLLMLFLGFNFFSSTINYSKLRIELIVAVIALLFLVRSRDDQSRYYSAFFVESIPIIWFLLILYK